MIISLYCILFVSHQQMLEKQLAEILRQAFQQCHTLGAQLRLLEVFEGISSRELVQVHDICDISGPGPICSVETN